jgi:hypothetical protein
VFDKNNATFYDVQTNPGAWVGLDLGTGHVITEVRFVPRQGLESRMVGGIFQGADNLAFTSNVTVLHTVTTQPGFVQVTVPVTQTRAFRFIRYLAPSGSSGNVSEILFIGKVAASGNG